MIGGLFPGIRSKTNLAAQKGRMADVLQSEIVAGEEAIMKQGDTVRSMKASLKEGKAEKVWVEGKHQCQDVRDTAHL